MREQELWDRMEQTLGAAYARVWADSVVLADLNGRTVLEAIRGGVSYKTIWRAVWRFLELAESER